MSKRPLKRRLREPNITREKLLQAGFMEIHLNGFQAASLDTILARAGMTKGALYHHFPNKAALGLAVVDEVVKGFLLERWLGPLGAPEADPLTAIQRALQQRADSVSAEEVELGCPLNNLAQEMSPLDERFRRRINATLDAWSDGFAVALERGQKDGTIRPDVDPRRIASFIVSSVEGSYGMAKGAKITRLFRSNLGVLIGFLETLRVRSA